MNVRTYSFMLVVASRCSSMRVNSGSCTLSVRCLQIIWRFSDVGAIHCNFAQENGSYGFRSFAAADERTDEGIARVAEERHEQGKMLQEMAAKRRIEKVLLPNTHYFSAVIKVSTF